MRRFLYLALLAVSLLPLPGPVHAQATADQLNKLSLEALTARPSGGGGGYVGRSARSAGRPIYARRYSAARHYRYAPRHGAYHRAYGRAARYSRPHLAYVYRRPTRYAPLPRHAAPLVSHRSYRR